MRLNLGTREGVPVAVVAGAPAESLHIENGFCGARGARGLRFGRWQCFVFGCDFRAGKGTREPNPSRPSVSFDGSHPLDGGDAEYTGWLSSAGLVRLCNAYCGWVGVLVGFRKQPVRPGVAVADESPAGMSCQPSCGQAPPLPPRTLRKPARARRNPDDQRGVPQVARWKSE